MTGQYEQLQKLAKTYDLVLIRDLCKKMSKDDGTFTRVINFLSWVPEGKDPIEYVVEQVKHRGVRLRLGLGELTANIIQTYFIEKGIMDYPREFARIPRFNDRKKAHQSNFRELAEITLREGNYKKTKCIYAAGIVPSLDELVCADSETKPAELSSVNMKNVLKYRPMLKVYVDLNRT
ncbi:hypothetical protein JXB27_00465 [Candidatus Woesearchaeota archaeon]|nr:hypothetical protein [Candidatus Woesearchaeota archaeon]